VCLQGKTVVAVTSGANINFERLRLVSELADLGASTEVMMATTIPERPGAFKEFVDAATGGSGSLSVTEFKYRCEGAAGRGPPRACAPNMVC
jgi:threonine dehydratase